MTIQQALDMIQQKIKFKENQIRTRKLQVENGKFETITSIIEYEIKNLQKDIEFLKSLELELS